MTKSNHKTELLDRYVFKALAHQISAEELELYMYQDHVLENINSNDLINDLVNINYRNNEWLKDLDRVVKKHYDEITLLVESIRFGCLKILESRGEREILDIVNRFSSLCIDYDYEYESLFKFYVFQERINMILDKYLKKVKRKSFMMLRNFPENTLIFIIQKEMLIN